MTTATRKWETNPSRGYLMLAVYIDGAHCGYCEDHLAADRLVAEITAKREAAATAAYIAPRPAVRKAKVKKSTKPACTCPRCMPFGIPDEMAYCRIDHEWLAYHMGLLIAADNNRLRAEDALRNHRYNLLTKGNASPADLDAEQAADVLDAQNLEMTTTI